jgi:hypothetical protein
MLDQQAPPDFDRYSSHPKPPGAVPVSARSIVSFAESPLPPTLQEWLDCPPDTPTPAWQKIEVGGLGPEARVTCRSARAAPKHPIWAMGSTSGSVRLNDSNDLRANELNDSLTPQPYALYPSRSTFYYVFDLHPSTYISLSSTWTQISLFLPCLDDDEPSCSITQ